MPRIRRQLSDLHPRELLQKAAEALQILARAEVAAEIVDGYYWRDGKVIQYRPVEGLIRCASCGCWHQWIGTGLIEGGHCLKGRTNKPSAMLLRQNVLPQCVSCNKYNDGRPERMKAVSIATFGQKAWGELQLAYDSPQVMPSKPELIATIKQYRAALKKAKAKL